MTALPTSDSIALLQGACALPDLGVIQAQGEDVASFLHNQLTNDVLLLPVGQARLAAFCSAKGRMQASFVVLKTAPDTVLLVMPRDLLARTLQRLSMFVLRAKVKLADASTHWQLWGLLGAATGSTADTPAPWSVSADGPSYTVRLYPAAFDGTRVPRALWLAPASAAPMTAAALPIEHWHWAEVLAAVPLLTAPLFELYVPQMLNYESVGGVNFKKGCYPGQEVVARSQYRGTLKRRMSRVFSRSPLAPGQELFANDPQQPCATVVMSAARPASQGWDALVSGTAEIRDLPDIENLGVPYELSADIN